MLKTELADRTLWYDGDSSYETTKLLFAMKRGNIQFVTEMSPLVEEYNRNVAASQELRIKDKCGELTCDWTIPEKYKSLDVVEYLFNAHAMLFEHLDPVEFEKREERLAKEIVLYQKQDLFDVLRAIIWIINTLTAANTVWGIGRGSSVSSYALYVVGVHDVDSYAYDLDIDDFLH